MNTTQNTKQPDSLAPDNNKNLPGDEKAKRIRIVKAKAEDKLKLLKHTNLKGISEMDEIAVGYISENISKKIHRVAGEVIMNQQSLQHISEFHAKELKNVGMTAIDFVKFIVNNFNEIRKGRTNELFLIVKNGLSKIAIIRMNYEKGKYIVETATVMRSSFINKKELLWSKERTL